MFLTSWSDRRLTVHGMSRQVLCLENLPVYAPTEYDLWWFLCLRLFPNSQHGPTLHPKLHRNTFILLQLSAIFD